jgi:hypothetical protein
LAVEHIQAWYWTGDTVINSVAVADVDGDGGLEVVTGGYFNDGARDVAQLIVWNGTTLTLQNIQTWYWTGDTVINSAEVGSVDGNGSVEVVTGGYFNDGIRSIAQMIVWG